MHPEYFLSSQRAPAPDARLSLRSCARVTEPAHKYRVSHKIVFWLDIMDPSTDTKCHLGVSDRELRMLFQPSVGFRRWQGARSRVFAQDNCSAVTEVKSGWVSFWLLATFTSQILYLKTNLVLKFRKIQSLAMFIRFFAIFNWYINYPLQII